MIKKINWLEILFWVVMMGLFIMILSRIFGKSATDIQIYLAFFTGLLMVMGHIIKLNNNISKLSREFGDFKAKTINSFDKFKEDMSLIKNKLKVKQKK